MLQLVPLDLHTDPGAALLDKVRHETSPQLVAVADHFVRAFIVGSPFAPGFHCVGAELALDQAAAAAYGMPRLSVTGNGETLETALISCLGEAVDRLAAVERPGDILATGLARQAGDGLAGTWIAQAIQSPVDELDWIEARDVMTSRSAALPADLCLRRAPDRRRIEPVGALSAGVAAGPDFASAALRAALELCERDAAALWWLGGKRPKAFPMEHAANLMGAKLIENLRQGRTDRRTLLLDITTDLGIPAVAAVSLNGDGHGLACGLAARLGWGDAARAAILEMCQMELAAPLAEAKRAERGDAALNDIDRRHLQRAAFAASNCALIHPRDVSGIESQGLTGNIDLRGLASGLDGLGVRLFAVDLTRPDIGVAMARMVSTELQPYTPDVVTERLRQCRAANSGLYLATEHVPLI
jgi:thiazole/oxazole-forming peptide maturase SagD family component